MSSSILSALYDFGKNHTVANTVANTAISTAPVSTAPSHSIRSQHTVTALAAQPISGLERQTDELKPLIQRRPVAAPPPCGEPPAALTPGVPNVLLIGDSISMGHGFYNGSVPKCPLQSACQPDNRLG